MDNKLEQDALKVQLGQKSIKQSLQNKEVDMTDVPFQDYHNKVDSLGGDGTAAPNYNDLTNKPTINGEVLAGDKPLSAFGIVNYDDTEIRQELNKKQPGGDYAYTKDVPKAISQLTNDANFIEKNTEELVNYYTKQEIESKQYVSNAEIAKVGKSGAYLDLSGLPNIPSKVSDLINDQNFIDNAVNNLINYYTKNEIYPKDEIDKMITNAMNGGVRIAYAKTVQDVISPNVIYLISRTVIPTNNPNTTEKVYDEYIFFNQTPLCIGTTEKYYTKEEIDKQFMTSADLELGLGKKGNTYTKRLTNLSVDNWVQANSIIPTHPFVGEILVEGLTERDWKVVDFYTTSADVGELWHEVNVLDGKIQFYATKDLGRFTFNTIDVSNILTHSGYYYENQEFRDELSKVYAHRDAVYTKSEVNQEIKNALPINISQLDEITNTLNGYIYDLMALVVELKEKQLITGDGLKHILVDDLKTVNSTDLKSGHYDDVTGKVYI